MIQVTVTNGHVQKYADGQIKTLMVEIGIGMGSLMKMILDDAPSDEVRDVCVKSIFEIALETMGLDKEDEDDE